MSGRSHFRGFTHSKLSFTLQRFRLFGVALKPCCGYSCFHPQEPPCGNVLRRIDVSVMHCPAMETGPFPVGQAFPALGPLGPPLRGGGRGFSRVSGE